jgi:hypothetical protein
MVRRIAIEIDGQAIGTAELRDLEAPRTSDAVWESLPWQSQLMHCTSSGECVFFAVTKPLSIDSAAALAPLTGPSHVVHGLPRVLPENLTVMVSQGDFVLTPDKACIIVYGRRCMIRAYVGELPSNAFAMIREPKIIDRLEAVATRTLTEGAKTIVIRRATESHRRGGAHPDAAEAVHD